MPWLEPVVLAGERVLVEPLRPEQSAGLVQAASDGRLWELWYTSIPSPAGMSAEIDRRLGEQAAGRMLPFAVRSAAGGELLGMTNYWAVDAVNRRVEIGGTWLRASAQRTAANAECKLLLLTHAFDVLGCIAVEFRTHWHNHQSRSAIARLGAKQDGVLRSHAVSGDGELRDTVVFSIIAAEWPAVRHGLEHRLGRAQSSTVPPLRQ